MKYDAYRLVRGIVITMRILRRNPAAWRPILLPHIPWTTTHDSLAHDKPRS